MVDPATVAVQGASRPTTRSAFHADYQTNPREITLRLISAIADVHTRVSDLYSSPHDQVSQQLRLTIDSNIRHSQSHPILINKTN